MAELNASSESRLLAGSHAGGHRWRGPLVWVLLITALVISSANNFREMWIRWYPAWRRPGLGLYERLIQGQSYYSHGPLVPLVSLLIAWLLIRKTKIPVRPSPKLGYTVLAASLLAHVASCLARVNFLGCFALIGVLAGVILLLWGRTALRRLWFPLAFLAFMVPLPEVSIARLNFRLKMFAAEWGVRLANLLGVIVERSGNQVYIAGADFQAQHKVLVIANVCNGLRTLITVIGFGAIYAYVCRLHGIWRLLLFAMSVPVALVANSIRIVALIVVADIWDEKVATGWFHDFSGAMIFVLAFLMMFGVERLIQWLLSLRGKPPEMKELFADVRRGPEDEGQVARLRGAAGTRRGWVLVVLVTLSAAMAVWLNRVVPPATDMAVVGRAVPRVLVIGGRQWTGYDFPLDENTLTILETPDYVCRQYAAVGEPNVEFTAVFSKDNRKGIHPPDLCLAGGGSGIVSKGNILVTGIPGRGGIDCRELVTQAGSRKRYFLYFYKCGSTYTGSFWKQQFVILLNGLLDRNAAGALIRVSTAVPGNGGDDDIASARHLSMAFVRAIVPHLDKALP